MMILDIGCVGMKNVSLFFSDQSPDAVVSLWYQAKIAEGDAIKSGFLVCNLNNNWATSRDCYGCLLANSPFKEALSLYKISWNQMALMIDNKHEAQSCTKVVISLKYQPDLFLFFLFCPVVNTLENREQEKEKRKKSIHVLRKGDWRKSESTTEMDHVLL